MPTGTALSTTKRKFHKILDSISNASSTSLASKSNHDKYNNASTTTLPATMDPPAKKPRIARPTSAYVAPSTRILTSQSPNLPAAAAATVKQPPSTAMIHQERKPPNFAPWDREQFLERLKTYRHVDKWMGKPESINEVQWAKRGWSCVGKERVGCVGGCGKEVVITLESVREERRDTEETQDTGKRLLDEEEVEDEWREKAQEQLVDKYAEMIVTSHDGGCLWRRKGCDDTIQRLPLAHHKSAIEHLHHRYESLVAIASELPPNPSAPTEFDLPSISQKLSPLIHPPPATTTITTPPNASPPPPLNPSALALSLFGWQAEEAGHVIGLATCTACFRRLGLWLFKPPPSSPSLPPSSSPSDSIPQSSSMHRLDLISEHRTYCPWINTLAQNGTASQRTSLDGLAGWEMLLRAVDAGANFKKHERENREADGMADKSVNVTARRGSEVASLAPSTATTTMTKGEELVGRDERDRERWAKLKRLKQAFHVKRKGKGKESGKGKGNEVGKSGNVEAG